MSEEAKPPRDTRFQFTLLTIMLIMVLVSIFAAIFGGFFRGDDGDYKPKLVMLTLMAPVALMIFFACVYFVMSRRSRKRKKKW